MLANEWLDFCEQRGFQTAYGAALAGPSVGRGGFRLGASIYDGSHLISSGFNSYKTHPKLAKHTEWPFLHAEQHAMFKAGLDNCHDLEMYVIRIGKDGNIRMAKPCDICQYFLKEAQIKTVYYSTEEGLDIWEP